MAIPSNWQQRPLRYFPSARDIHMEKDAMNANMDTARILIQSLIWDAGSWMSKKP
jgi:hypothetical protein